MLDGKKVLALIPARGGSVRIPDKNLRSIGANSLVASAILVARSCKLIDTIVVSSDSDEILAEARKFPEVTLIKRPDYLATSEATMAVVVEHTNYIVQGHEIFVLLEPSTPLRAGKDLENVLRATKMNSQSPAVTVTKYNDQRTIVNINDDGSAQRNSSRTLKKGVLALNGGAIAFFVNRFITEQNFYPPDTTPCLMPVSRSADIDTRLGLFRAEVIFDYKTILTSNADIRH
jgi:CMP-N,N'-diacetyllegionaminic acid synthase